MFSYSASPYEAREQQSPFEFPSAVRARDAAPGNQGVRLLAFAASVRLDVHAKPSLDGGPNIKHAVPRTRKRA